MAKRYGGGKDEKLKEFPPTHELESGKDVVAIALEQREVETRYGDRTVVECVIRGEDESKVFTIWWPLKLPSPPLQTPFYLKRISKKNYELLVPENAQEEQEMWENGPPKDAGATEEGASKVPVKFRSKVEA